MAKKKRKPKKRKLKYGKAESVRSAQPVKAEEAEQPVIVEAGRFDYVKRDVVQISILAGVFTGLLGLFWIIFNFTSLGTDIYNLIRL